MERIRIQVQGGLVQAVTDIPAGITVIVYDYDNYESEQTDEAGIPCSIAEFTANDTMIQGRKKNGIASDCSLENRITGF